jgi:hypothetical protein
MGVVPFRELRLRCFSRAPGPHRLTERTGPKETTSAPPPKLPDVPPSLRVISLHSFACALNLFFFLPSRTPTAALTLPDQSLIHCLLFRLPRNISFPVETPPANSHPKISPRRLNYSVPPLRQPQSSLSRPGICDKSSPDNSLSTPHKQ